MLSKVLGLMACLLAVPLVSATATIYDGQTYSKTFQLSPTQTVTQDIDASDGTVVYIYKIKGVYNIETGEEFGLTEEQISSVTVGNIIPYTLTFNMDATKPEGRYMAMAGIVKTDGTFESSTGNWTWTYSFLDKKSELFEAKHHLAPSPTNIKEIFEKIWDWFINWLMGIYNLFGG